MKVWFRDFSKFPERLVHVSVLFTTSPQTTQLSTNRTMAKLTWSSHTIEYH